MSRTEGQVAADYREFRGRCRELCDAARAADPTLTLVRGHYFDRLWCTDEPHWWLTKPDGTIVDPSARQFPTNGSGIYTPFDGMLSCAECGKEVREEDADLDGNYAFCCYACHGRFVGVL